MDDAISSLGKPARCVGQSTPCDREGLTVADMSDCAKAGATDEDTKVGSSPRPVPMNVSGSMKTSLFPHHVKGAARQGDGASERMLAPDIAGRPGLSDEAARPARAVTQGETPRLDQATCALRRFGPGSNDRGCPLQVTSYDPVMPTSGSAQADMSFWTKGAITRESVSSFMMKSALSWSAARPKSRQSGYSNPVEEFGLRTAERMWESNDVGTTDTCKAVWTASVIDQDNTFHSRLATKAGNCDAAPRDLLIPRPNRHHHRAAHGNQGSDRRDEFSSLAQPVIGRSDGPGRFRQGHALFGWSIRNFCPNRTNCDGQANEMP